MKDENEQAVTVVAASDVLGKFGSVAELFAAYNELEREFTKRCQLIKQLQAQLSLSGAQAATENEKAAYAEIEQDENNARVETNDTPKSDIVSGNTETASGVCAAAVSFDRDAVLSEIAANAELYAESLAELSAVMDACLARYKQKLISFDVSAPPSGLAVIVPKKRPRSLADAKRLADEMLGD